MFRIPPRRRAQQMWAMDSTNAADCRRPPDYIPAFRPARQPVMLSRKVTEGYHQGNLVEMVRVQVKCRVRECGIVREVDPRRLAGAQTHQTGRRGRSEISLKDAEISPPVSARPIAPAHFHGERQMLAGVAGLAGFGTAQRGKSFWANRSRVCYQRLPLQPDGRKPCPRLQCQSPRETLYPTNQIRRCAGAKHESVQFAAFQVPCRPSATTDPVTPVNRQRKDAVWWPR